MKRLAIAIILLLSVLALPAQDQIKGTGIRYTNGPPTIAPVSLSFGTEFAYDVANREIYMWDRTNSAWVRQINITQAAGGPSGSPGSGPKLYLDTDDGRLYRWNGSAWVEVGSAAGTSYTSSDIRDSLAVLAGNARLDGAYIKNDTVTAMVNDSIIGYFVDGAEVGRDTIRPAGGSGGGAPESIGPSNQILRVPTVGQTITASTPGEWLAWWSFTPPTLSSITFTPSTTVYEVGTSNAITLSGTTSNPAGATLSGGILQRTSPSTATINTFNAATSYSQGITFTPQQGGSGAYNELLYTFRASQDYSGSESGTVQSASKTLRAVYPVFYGMASTDTSAVLNNIYGTLTKAVVSEGNGTYSFTGTGLIYYCMPSTWTDTNLSSITDPNGFNVTSSFDRVTAYTLSSTGLTNNYTAQPCVCYVLNTGSTTTSSSSYTFNR